VTKLTYVAYVVHSCNSVEYNVICIMYDDDDDDDDDDGDDKYCKECRSLLFAESVTFGSLSVIVETFHPNEFLFVS